MKFPNEGHRDLHHTLSLSVCVFSSISPTQHTRVNSISMMSTTKMRPLVGILSGGRASVLAAKAGAGLKPGASPKILNLAAATRGIKVLGNSRTEKHLLDEFKSVKGPQSEEVRFVKVRASWTNVSIACAKFPAVLSLTSRA